MSRSYALDLGSTSFKTSWLNSKKQSLVNTQRETLSLSHHNGRYEAHPETWYQIASRLLNKTILGGDNNAKLTIATQRSTFLLWERDHGKPVTPLISWQDSRASLWCQRHDEISSQIQQKTGLMLLPFYAGPKLASLLENRNLKIRMTQGELLFGTLETYFLWLWSSKKIHQTDSSMAVRTLLANAHTGQWDDQLLKIFGVPRHCLPQISTSNATEIPLKNNFRFVTSLADQSAAALAVLGTQSDSLMINLGTGGFILKPLKQFKNQPNYLTTLLGYFDGQPFFCLEGTINGVSEITHRFKVKSIPFTNSDQNPNFWCLPDSQATGAPYWKKNLATQFSNDIQNLSLSELQRIILEGIVFRVTDITLDLIGSEKPKNIYLSGGLSQNSFIAPALATLLNQPVTLIHEFETTLLGAARLGPGLTQKAHMKTTTIEPKTNFNFHEKYLNWKEWIRSHL